MNLVIWTAAEASLIKETFGKSLKAMKPEVPPHNFRAWEKGVIPDTEAGEVLVVAGARPLDELVKAGLIPKNRTVTSLREKPVKLPSGAWALVTYDPFKTVNEPETKEVMDWDLRLATRLLKTGSLEPEIGEYRWVSSFDDLISRIKARYEKTGKPVEVAFDTETEGLHPWYPDKDIVCMSFTLEEGTADMMYLGPQEHPVELDKDADLYGQVKWLLTSPMIKLRLANGKYDMIWVAEKWGIECTNFKFDNLLVGTLLDENRSNSLNLHAKLFTTMGGYDDRFNREVDKGRMDLVHPDKLAPYMGGDTDATQRVANALRDELVADPQLARFYVKILHPAARAFEKIERRGVLVDQVEFGKLAKELREAIDGGYNRSLECLPVRMRVKYRDRIEDQLAKGKSPMLPSILKEYFFTKNGLGLKPKVVTEKTGEPSTAKSHLKQFADHPDAKAMVDALTQADQAAKTLSTFVEGFLKHLRPDGRFHPSYMLFHGNFNDSGDDSGTVTGRLSAKEPAIQIVPKKTFWAKKIRKAFVAPKGKKVLSLDYSQGELKVVACVSNEKTMLSAYEQGLDLHAVTGAKLGGVPLEEFLSWNKSSDAALNARFDKYRSNAKPANFGLLYGMGVEGFQAYAWANYGLKLSYAEAEAIRNGFFELYAGLLDYHENQRKLVRLAGQVRSPLGRIRHLPQIESWDRSIKSKAERQAINSPIQSCLSDMMLWAIALMDDAYPNGELELVAMIHDAVIAYVPEDEVELWAGRAAEIMSNLPFHEIGWKPQLRFTADAEAGDNLADMTKVKLA